uniref:Uncharacterized protein n=1 Tax=Dulem virus 196 TaxID=3145673 RepID=A0AAU8B6B4_9VIRU
MTNFESFKNTTPLLLRSPDEYISFLRRSVINFCTYCMDEKHSDVAEQYDVTPFTCTEMLYFIDRNLNKSLIKVDRKVVRL